ncbi:hypothetical protein D9M71_473990 [compost metagenome]
MGERDLFLAPQLHQVLRVIAAGIHLLEPEHGRHIRQAPGVHVEHRGDRHVHVVGAQQAHAIDRAHDGRHAHGVQHQLPMGEVHALGVAGGAGGIERGRDRVFVEVLEVVLRARRGQQLFVFADEIRQVRGFFRQVSQQQGFVDRGQLPLDGLVETDELAVDQHKAVLGVVHGVEDLFRRQAHVDGVDHRTDHRDGEHAFQVTMAVPVHHTHGIPGLDPGRCQHVGQAGHPFDQGRVAVAQLVAVDDLAGFLITGTGHQQPFDQQRVLVSAFGRGDNASLQHNNPFNLTARS